MCAACCIEPAPKPKNLEDALWREALARLVIDRLRACMGEPLNKSLEIEADDAELTYRLAREVHGVPKA